MVQMLCGCLCFRHWCHCCYRLVHTMVPGAMKALHTAGLWKLISQLHHSTFNWHTTTNVVAGALAPRQWCHCHSGSESWPPMYVNASDSPSPFTGTFSQVRHIRHCCNESINASWTQQEKNFPQSKLLWWKNYRLGGNLSLPLETPPALTVTEDTHSLGH